LRRLIINADDFGLTPGVNRAIIEAHQHGVVTSSTLMAVGDAFDDAAKLARQNPRLRVGCHVVLIDGTPLTAAAKIPTLTFPHGRFRSSLPDFAHAALRRRIREEDIAAEAKAQLAKLRAAGIRISHFDTHKHVHTFPPIARPLLRVAKEFGIVAVRNPFAPIKPMAFAHLMKRPRLWKRYSEVAVLRNFGARFRKLAAQEGLKTTDGTFGIVVTGALDERLFAAIVGCVPEGTWEFVCHPGYNDDALAKVKTRLRASRVAELHVLTSPQAKEVLRAGGIELITYADL
jgi:hopanoid biosynthesis associated protein HpnK